MGVVVVEREAAVVVAVAVVGVAVVVTMPVAVENAVDLLEDRPHSCE